MNLLNSRVHDRILAKKKRIDAHRPLSPFLLRKLQREMQIEYIYNSNAIEGNTLKLRETQLILEEGITVQGKSLREHREVLNHPEALKYVERLTRRKLKLQDILSLHQMTMKGIEDDAGRFRTTEVRIGGTDYVPQPAYEVPHLIEGLIDWCGRNPDELRPIELAAMLHHKLVSIHPFHDGNGRIARLLMNVILMQYGYPIVALLNVDRRKYYDTLKAADNGNPAPFVDFVAASVERSLDLYLRSLEPTKKGDELLTLAEASKISAYSPKYLNLLARKRRIPAIKVGRKWMITKRQMEQYVKEVDKR